MSAEREGAEGGADGPSRLGERGEGRGGRAGLGRRPRELREGQWRDVEGRGEGCRAAGLQSPRKMPDATCLQSSNVSA